jgi:hypothetical protein
MTAPFMSKLTRSNIVVDARLQQTLAARKQSLLQEPKQVRVVSIAIKVG